MAAYSSLQNIQPYGLYKNISASALIKTGPGNVAGVVVNSHTNGTLKLEDAVTDTTPVIFNTITFASGPGFYPLFGAKFTVGLYAVIGGTADITIIYN